MGFKKKCVILDCRKKRLHVPKPSDRSNPDFYDQNGLYKNYTILRGVATCVICNLLKKLVELKGIEPSTS